VEAAVTIEIEGGVRVHVRDVEHVCATWVAAMVSALGRGSDDPAAARGARIHGDRAGESAAVVRRADE
jgi:hypothetical protein